MVVLVTGTIYLEMLYRVQYVILKHTMFQQSDLASDSREFQDMEGLVKH